MLVGVINGADSTFQVELSIQLSHDTTSAAEDKAAAVCVKIKDIGKTWNYTVLKSSNILQGKTTYLQTPIVRQSANKMLQNVMTKKIIHWS